MMRKILVLVLAITGCIRQPDSEGLEDPRPPLVGNCILGICLADANTSDAQLLEQDPGMRLETDDPYREFRLVAADGLVAWQVDRSTGMEVNGDIFAIQLGEPRSLHALGWQSFYMDTDLAICNGHVFFTREGWGAVPAGGQLERAIMQWDPSSDKITKVNVGLEGAASLIACEGHVILFRLDAKDPQDSGFFTLDWSSMESSRKQLPIEVPGAQRGPMTLAHGALYYETHDSNTWTYELHLKSLATTDDDIVAKGTGFSGYQYMDGSEGYVVWGVRSREGRNHLLGFNALDHSHDQLTTETDFPLPGHKTSQSWLVFPSYSSAGYQVYGIHLPTMTRHTLIPANVGLGIGPTTTDGQSMFAAVLRSGGAYTENQSDVVSKPLPM